LSSTKPLRLRIFAGPNGSGKSTIIESIRRYQVFGRNIDLGIYINADDIAYRLQHSTLDFGDYDIKATKEEFIDLILDSGLINTSFPQTLFINSFEIKNNHMVIDESYHVDRISQIISEFLRRKLLIEKKKFSVETVFSHRSKIDFMMKAGSMGYRIYLYYISTKDPEINKYRVELRVKQGGHPVPPDKIKPISLQPLVLTG
jgi:predicted ABC-type ATPase